MKVDCDSLAAEQLISALLCSVSCSRVDTLEILAIEKTCRRIKPTNDV